MTASLTNSLNTLARVAGLRGTMLHFTPRSLPAVIRSYDPINLGATHQEYTVEVWIRADPTQSPPQGTTLVPLVAWSWKDGNADPYPFAIYLNLRSGNIGRPKLIRQLSNNTSESIEATVTINDGLFHHIAAVRRLLSDGSAYLQVYVDGDTDPTWTSVSSTTVSASAIEGSLCTFGGGLIQMPQSDPVYSGFNGDISQVRVWQGALSGSQILALRYEALMGPIEVLDAEGGQASGTVKFAGNSIAGTVVATAEGVQYYTVDGGSSSGNYEAIAVNPGPTGNTPANSITTIVSYPYGATPTTLSSNTAFTGGSDPYGGQAATGAVTLSNSGTDPVTVPVGFLVQVGPSGPQYALTSGGSINASSSANFFVRATQVGAAGNVAAASINTISFPNLAPNLTVTNAAATTGGVNPVAPEDANYSTGFIHIGNNSTTRAVTLPAGTVVGVSTNGVVNPSLLFALVSQAIVPAGGSTSNVKIQAVFPGSGSAVGAGQINWVSPLYLGPSDAVSVSNPNAIAAVPPRLVKLVGCWTCDEGFGRVVYNYASNSGDLASQGNGSFDPAVLGAYSLSALGTLPSDMGDPEWVITTLMAPPPFVS